MGPNKIKVERALVCGLGSIGERHLGLLRQRLPKAQIMVLRHRHHDGGPIPNADLCVSSLDEALAFKPQVAIVASPATVHAQQAIALIKTGAHVLVEKPMATNSIDAHAMADAAYSSGALLRVGYNLRYLESLNVFRNALHSGHIGRVASIRAEVGQYLPDWRPGRDWRSSVSARADLGGGALLELSHEIDYLLWIFGNVSEVRGWLGQQGELGLDVEDTVHAIIHFEESTPIHPQGLPPVASLTLDFIRRDTVRRCTAVGEKGTIIWDGIESKVLLVPSDKKTKVLHENQAVRNSSYISQIDSFINEVEAGVTLTKRDTAGTAVLEVIEAVRKSHSAHGSAAKPIKP